MDILRSAWSEDKPRRQIDEPSELQGLVNKRVAKEKAKKADADFGRDFPICLDQEDPWGNLSEGFYYRLNFY